MDKSTSTHTTPRPTLSQPLGTRTKHDRVILSGAKNHVGGVPGSGLKTNSSDPEVILRSAQNDTSSLFFLPFTPDFASAARGFSRRARHRARRKSQLLTALLA